MNPFEEDACWDVLDDYSTIPDFDVSEFYLTSPSNSTAAGISMTCNISTENGLKRVREQRKTCTQSESKAYRERLRREKLNERFSELDKFLHPESLSKGEKSSILADAISALYKLKSEHQVLKERKKKLEIGTENLKEEKNELREEKLQLLGNKRKIEQQIKAMPVAPGGFMPMQHAIYQAGGNKGMVVSGYAGYPMWQWIPPAVLDTSQDHVLRPPVA